IASCLYKYHSIMDWNEKSIRNRSAPKFLLIGGDISGIQNFIYNVKSPQQAQKGMSKRLRGRSFYISLLTETFAHYTLTELKLPITNLLWCGGGHFFILAPNIEKTIKKLSKIKSAINKYLLKEFQGELYLAIGIADASGEDISKNFSDILNEVNYELSKVKNEKYFELFNQSEVDVFGPYALKKDVCNICGKDIDAKECTVCELHEDIGKKIPKTNYLVEIRTTGYAKEVEDLIKIKFTDFNLYWKLLEKSEIKAFTDILEKINKEEQKIDCIRVHQLNKTDLLEDKADNELINLVKNSNLPITLGFKLIGNTAPMIYEDKVLSFDEIAQFGEGINLLGILRMDVDDLGAIFSIGIPKGSRSISRISTLSKKLDLFFLGYLNRITEKYKLHTILCNDCKNKIKEQNYKLRELKIEMEIDEEENKNKLLFYEVKNPDGKYNSSKLCSNCKKSAMSKLYITYSGGDDVFIVGAYDDIVEVAYDIQEQFREYTCKNPNIGISAGIFLSKEKFPIGRSARYAGNELDNKAKKHENKNAISVFGECVYWEDFKNLKAIGDRLIKEVRNKKLSRSMVHYLLELHNQYNTSDPDYNLMYLPKLIYVVRRNIKDNDLCKYFIENLARDLDSKIKIIVSWVSLKTRKDKK
ncbi:MAG: type III-A CRISPR-associated protein Cas10/Csm1, partial [Methanosarcinales archaeon]